MRSLVVRAGRVAAVGLVGQALRSRAAYPAGAAGLGSRGRATRKWLRPKARETFREEAMAHARSRRKNLAIIKK